MRWISEGFFVEKHLLTSLTPWGKFSTLLNPFYNPPGWPGVLPLGQADDMCITNIQVKKSARIAGWLLCLSAKVCWSARTVSWSGTTWKSKVSLPNKCLYCKLVNSIISFCIKACWPILLYASLNFSCAYQTVSGKILQTPSINYTFTTVILTLLHKERVWIEFLFQNVYVVG